MISHGLQTKVPSLIQGVKDMGILLGVYGHRAHTSSLTASTTPDANLVDAVFHDGLISFVDHSSRALY